MVVESARGTVIDTSDIDAFIFDLDGVVTDTAGLHARSWKEVFDQLLMQRSEASGDVFRPFDIDTDYTEYVDGKPRYDGARSFLESRGIYLPLGGPDDPPGRGSVCGVANLKNELFQQRLEAGIEPYWSTVELIRSLADRGIRSAIISSSRNAEAALKAAGVADLFEVRVDGVVSAELGIPGKPDPAIFLEAAKRLQVKPDRAVVVEDALSGVEAGSRGGFALVIGVDRAGQADALAARGADVVVSDLSEIALGEVQTTSEIPARAISELPSALDLDEEIWDELARRPPAVFLDYDGTLTPIVDDPDEALLPEQTGAVLRRLRAKCLVAVLSGRDLADVREKVAVDGLVYAGSHGLEIETPDSVELSESVADKFAEFLAPLRSAEDKLADTLGSIGGVRIERKRFAIAVHYRAAAEEDYGRVEREVAAIAEGDPALRMTGGKKVFELRPASDWNKGKALDWLIGALGYDRASVFPIYIGDDVTDEDAFREIQADGLGVLVVDTERRASGEDTAARFVLQSPSEVRALLEQLSDRID